MAKKNIDKKSQSIKWAFVATFLSIIGFIIAIIEKKDDKYVMYYATQGFLVFILSIFVSAINKILIIPVISSSINSILNLTIFIFWIISWVNALSGKKKELPFIGQYGKLIKF